jgi:hypothetical protein
MFIMSLSTFYVHVIEAYSHALAIWVLGSDSEAHLPPPGSGPQHDH